MVRAGEELKRKFFGQLDYGRAAIRDRWSETRREAL
jgi:hypothetical protein